MQRTDDWAERLAAFVEERQKLAFEWGPNDCVTHAADAVQAMTGEDPLGPLRGAWSDEASARLALAEHGGLQAAVTGVMGDPLATPMLAQRGDVVLVRLRGVTDDASDTELLAICLGARWCAPAERYGAVRGPMSQAVVAWPVGRAA